MYKVYCDFDATVTVNDVWHELFNAFGKPRAFEVWQEFNAGQKTAAECIRVACSTVENASIEKTLALFRSQPLREGFREFTEYCKAKGLELSIVSDGFSSYIRTILEHQGLAHIPVWTNTVELTDSGTLTAEFPHQREGCRHCACCKCARLLATSAEEDTTVYIGDGYSDVCPVRMSDVVFARANLLTFCSANGIPHHPFRDFTQVQTILDNYLKDRPKFRRVEARRRRNELIMIE